MSRVRWLMTTLALPLAYAAIVYQATRPPKASYKFAKPTVMTVTDDGGPAIPQAPPGGAGRRADRRAVRPQSKSEQEEVFRGQE